MQEQVTYEKPREYTKENVSYHEPLSKALKFEKKGKALLNKAKKFLENNCIEQKSLTVWHCKPIKDYNKTTHIIRSVEDGFICTCQGFRKKEDDFIKGHTDVKPLCSHILAVKQLNFIEKENE